MFFSPGVKERPVVFTYNCKTQFMLDNIFDRTLSMLSNKMYFRQHKPVGLLMSFQHWKRFQVTRAATFFLKVAKVFCQFRKDIPYPKCRFIRCDICMRLFNRYKQQPVYQ